MASARPAQAYNFSKVALPLTRSTALTPAEWQSTSEIQAAQKQLVDLFTTAPVLKHFDPELQAIVETDASDFVLGAILSQRHGGMLHPCAFHSRKFTSAEVNYDTVNKELLAIVDSFKRWRRYLEGAKHQVMVITTWSCLPQRKSSIAGKRDGRKSLPGTTLKSSFDLANRTSRQITCQGSRGTASRRGMDSSSRSRS